MSDGGIGDYFISDVDDAVDEDDDILSAPVVVPVAPAQPVAAPADAVPAAELAPPPSRPAPVAAPGPATATRPQAAARQATREERLVATLDRLMENSPDVQAAALVSLDGFTMASALPSGMQEDRVGAMSAAILGLGERAAEELGRGTLSQVFIEGKDGYVLLMAAGERAVLTALADPQSKLGLVLYDMRETAAEIGGILT